MSQAAIDSREVEVRYTIEDSFKTVSDDNIWRVIEVNEFGDYGPTYTLTARTPFRADRQRSKGTQTGFDAAGGFTVDLLQDQNQPLVQEMFHAAFREKPTAEALNIDEEIDSVDGTLNDFVSDGVGGNDWSTRGFVVGHLIWTTGFANSANNGLFTVDSVSSTNLGVSETTLVDELSAAIPLTAAGVRGAHIVAVGVQFAAGDLDVDDSGNFATYTTTTFDFTTLGLNPGEWIYVGGDTAATQLDTAANNGWKRIRSIAANALVVDKSENTMVTEANAADTIQMYFGRVVKNESVSTLITQRTIQLERNLGAPDDAQPTELQGDYLTGCTANTLTITKEPEGKITMEMAFLPAGYEILSAAAAPNLKSAVAAAATGGAPAVVSEDAFNTDSDFSRLRIAVVNSSAEAPTPLFTDIERMALTINNNANPNKALRVRGSCGASLGTFEAGGDLTGYFEDIASITAVDQNSDVTMDAVLVKGQTGSRHGIAWDMPIIALSGGRPELELGIKVKLPLELNASDGSKVLSTMNHTLMMSYFDHLPEAAAAT